MKVEFLYLNNKVNLKMSQGLHLFYKVLNQLKTLKRKIISNKLKRAPETTLGSSRNESIIFVRKSKACCI